MHARRIALTFGALLLSLALAGSASASSQVKVEYDLSGTSFDGFVPWTDIEELQDEGQGNPVNLGLGSMTVVYQSNTAASDLTIQTGAAIIESMQLGWGAKIYNKNVTPYPTARSASGALKASFFATPNQGVYHGITLSLTTPIGASLTPNGRLTAQGANVFLQAVGYFNRAGSFAGFRTNQTATFNVPVGYDAGTDGPFGNGYHWVDGRTTAPGVATPNAGGGTTGGGGHFTIATGTLYSGTFNGPATTHTTGARGQHIVIPGEVTLVGREISRVPEPGSLLLLGSGLAGLAALGGTGAVGHRLRRARRG